MRGIHLVINAHSDRRLKFYFMEIEDMGQVTEGPLVVTEKGNIEQGEEPVSITLNALFGNSGISSNTMRLVGSFDNKTAYFD